MMIFVLNRRFLLFLMIFLLMGRLFLYDLNKLLICLLNIFLNYLFCIGWRVRRFLFFFRQFLMRRLLLCCRLLLMIFLLMGWLFLYYLNQLFICLLNVFLNYLLCLKRGSIRLFDLRDNFLPLLLSYVFFILFLMYFGLNLLADIFWCLFFVFMLIIWFILYMPI